MQNSISSSKAPMMMNKTVSQSGTVFEVNVDWLISLHRKDNTVQIKGLLIGFKHKKALGLVYIGVLSNSFH